MNKLSVIIVNYNTKDVLKDCLLNLQSLGLDLEIIVVDNGSTDGSADLVEENFEKVILVRSENKGLAYGSNLGLLRAKGEYVLYLGTDAYPKKEDLTGIISYMDQHQDVGVSTAKLVTRDGEEDLDAHRGFPTPWAAITYFSKLYKVFPKTKLFNSYFLGYKDMSQPHEIDLCIAHFMTIRKKVFSDIGNWDENFFLYGEDVDFCYRVKQAGWKIMYLPQFSVLHYKGIGVGIRKQTADISKVSNEVKTKMKLETTKAMKLFYEKHYVNVYPKWLTGLVLFGISVISKLREKGFFLS